MAATHASRRIAIGEGNGRGWRGQLSNICDNNLEPGIEAWRPPANLGSAYMDCSTPFFVYRDPPSKFPCEIVRILLFPRGNIARFS